MLVLAAVLSFLSAMVLFTLAQSSWTWGLRLLLKPAVLLPCLTLVLRLD